MTTSIVRPANLHELRESGWVSKTVKREIYDNFMARLAEDEELFPGHRRLREHGHPRDQLWP